MKLKVNKLKKTCHLVRKTLDFFENSFVPFHRVTFDHSISFMLLIDKPNEEQQKYLQSFINSAIYHPMNPDVIIIIINLFIFGIKT